MQQLTYEFNKIKTKYPISTQSNDFSSSNSTINNNPLPLSLKLLDTSSIGLHNKLNDYLKDNERLNVVLKDYVGNNYSSILNDNMTTYLEIYREYAHAKSIDCTKAITEGDLNGNSTKNLRYLNDTYVENFKMIQLISLVQYITKEQEDIINIIFNTSNGAININQYNYIIKSYKNLDNLIAVNKLYLFYDISILNNNNKIKEKIRENLFSCLMDLIFKSENVTLGKSNNLSNAKYIKTDLQYIIFLFDQINSNDLENPAGEADTNSSYEFVLQNLEKTLLDRFENILKSEVNHLREDMPSKYETIKKYKFKNFKDFLSYSDKQEQFQVLNSSFSKISLNNANLDSAALAKAAEVDIIVFEFFNGFFQNLNAKIVYLLLLVDLMDSGCEYMNNNIIHNGNDRIVKIVENFLLKILKMYLIPSLNNNVNIPKNNLNKDVEEKKLFVLNKDSLLACHGTRETGSEKEEEEYSNLQALFNKVLPEVSQQNKAIEKTKEDISRIAITKNDMFLIIPSNLINLKYILPNMTSIIKTLTKFSESTHSSFLVNFLNDFYINELFNNNVTYILNTKIYNINLTHGEGFFKINQVIETFITIINKILNFFPGLEYQYNAVLMTKIHETFSKFVTFIVTSFKNFIKMFVNVNTLNETSFSDFQSFLSIANHIKGSTEYATINDSFILRILETYKGLNKLTTWFKTSILGNINLVDDLKQQAAFDEGIYFEDLKEMWLLNDRFYEYSHIDENEYAASIDGILISPTLNNKLHELIYNKLDDEFFGGLFKEKVQLFTLFEVNKLMMGLILNDNLKKSKGAADKFEYLYLREDNHVDDNVVTINAILQKLNQIMPSAVGSTIDKFMNFIVVNNFINLKYYDRIAYILHNLKHLQATVDITRSIDFLKVYELNVNDIIEFSNQHKNLYPLASLKHMIKLKLEYESGNNTSILQKRLDESYKKLK